MDSTYFSIRPERGSRFGNCSGFNLGENLGTSVFPFTSQTALQIVHMH